MSSVVSAGRERVSDGVWEMPSTFVHCFINSVALIDVTVKSEVPCQIATFGRGPW